MKEFFKKSTVYQNFKREEDKELAQAQECKETQHEIEEVQTQYSNLKKKFDSLNQLVQTQSQGKGAPETAE